MEKEETRTEQENDEVKEDKVYSQWAAFNNSHHTMKLICVTLSVLSLLVVVLCFYVGDKTPIVVREKAGDLEYLAGSKQKVTIDEKNIKRLIRSYIDMRYTWDRMNIKQIARNISPFVTNGLEKKTKAQLQQYRTKEFKGKLLKQRITTPDIVVTKESTRAYFYRVLIINQIPLLIPMQIQFGLVKGDVTNWNRLGIYINAKKVYEGS